MHRDQKNPDISIQGENANGFDVLSLMQANLRNYADLRMGSVRVVVENMSLISISCVLMKPTRGREAFTMIRAFLDATVSFCLDWTNERPSVEVDHDLEGMTIGEALLQAVTHHENLAARKTVGLGSSTDGVISGELVSHVSEAEKLRYVQ